MAVTRMKNFGLGCLLTLTRFGGGCLHGKLTIRVQQLQLAVRAVPSACVRDFLAHGACLCGWRLWLTGTSHGGCSL